MIDLDPIKNSIARAIMQATDVYLNGTSIDTSLKHQFFVKNMTYSKENSKKSFGTIIFDEHTRPANLVYRVGHVYHFAKFQFAVLGDPKEIVKVFSKPILTLQNLTYPTVVVPREERLLDYTVYREKEFINDDIEINAINEQARNKKNFIEEKIKEYNTLAVQANAALSTFAAEELEKERNRRTELKTFKDKFDPF